MSLVNVCIVLQLQTAKVFDVLLLSQDRYYVRMLNENAKIVRLVVYYVLSRGSRICENRLLISERSLQVQSTVCTIPTAPYEVNEGWKFKIRTIIKIPKSLS